MVVGAGIKFPVGISDKQNTQFNRMSLLNQNGTGSLDHFYYVNYMLSQKWWGLATNCMFKINGTNQYKEKFANSYSQVFNLFAKLDINDFNIFPAVFANYEYSKGLLVNGNLEAGTNIDVLLLGPSLDVSYKSFVLNTSYQFNVYERVSSQSLANAGRFVIGLTYNFDQNKYLIKSKN
jgi:hypothetical protein